jgi:prephenate dehydrogenase
MTVGIVGLGLIGGSIGLALREPGRKILGYDPNAASAKVAFDRGCFDMFAELDEVCKADVVFVAVPPKHVVEVLKAVSALKGPETIYTDCTSVKAEVVEWAVKVDEPNFVIGHPMAGHERTGAAFASAWLFRGSKWILCPLKNTSLKALKKVDELIAAVGATSVQMDATAHDREIAVVSHLPHALAGVLVQLADGPHPVDVTGGSWRDLTRVGGVDPGLWAQIFIANRAEVSKAIENAQEKLSELKGHLDANEFDGVWAFFASSKNAKERAG